MRNPDDIRDVARAVEGCSVAELRIIALDLEDCRKTTNQEAVNGTVLAHWAAANVKWNEDKAEDKGEEKGAASPRIQARLPRAIGAELEEGLRTAIAGSGGSKPAA